MNQAKIKTFIPYLIGAVVVAAVAYFVWQNQQEGDYAGFAKAMAASKPRKLTCLPKLVAMLKTSL